MIQYKYVSFIVVLGSLVPLCAVNDATTIDSATKQLHQELKKGFLRYQIIKSLLNQGADINKRIHSSTNVLYDEATPLDVAASYGDVKLTTFLIQHGATINAQHMESGLTALSRAVDAGKKDVVKILIESGADVNTHDCQGFTPLMCAAQLDHPVIAQILINHKADVNVHNPQPESIDYAAISIALRGGHKNMVELLLKNGATINTKDKNGYTLLHKAVSALDERMVYLFLTELNADPSICTNEGNTISDLIQNSERSSDEARVAAASILHLCRMQCFEHTLLPLIAAYQHLCKKNSIHPTMQPTTTFPHDIFFREIGKHLLGSDAIQLPPSKKIRTCLTRDTKTYCIRTHCSSIITFLYGCYAWCFGIMFAKEPT